MLLQVICRGNTYLHAVQKMQRALYEFHIRGVKTNILFLENVLRHPEFLSGKATTSFIDRSASQQQGYIASFTVLLSAECEATDSGAGHEETLIKLGAWCRNAQLFNFNNRNSIQSSKMLTYLADLVCPFPHLLLIPHTRHSYFWKQIAHES